MPGFVNFPCKYLRQIQLKAMHSGFMLIATQINILVYMYVSI